MKAINKKTIKVTIGTILLSLVSSTIYDLIKSQPFLSSLVKALKFIWSQILALLNMDVKIYWVMLTLSAFVLIYQFVIKAKNKLLNTKIGLYTFKELHRIMRTEHIHGSNSAIVWKDFSQFTLLEIFEAVHSRLSAGVNIENDLFLYHDFCPRLYVFGLMDRKDEQHYNPDIITHDYTFNDNGMLFWAVLNKLSIKNRLKTEKMKELQQRLQKAQLKNSQTA